MKHRTRDKPGKASDVLYFAFLVIMWGFIGLTVTGACISVTEAIITNI